MKGIRTIFIKNLPADITEEQIEEAFRQYGTVEQVTIPKDKFTGKPKGIAFVEYYKEECAKTALRLANGSRVYGYSVVVAMAYEPSYRAPRKSWSPVNRSRSRSPSISLSEADLRQKIDELSAINHDLQTQHLNLERELEDLNKRIHKQKNKNSDLEVMLQAYSAGTVIYLPCGHRKQLKMQDKVLLDELYEVGLSKLTEGERNDERVTRKLWSLIFYKIAGKLPDIYRCDEEESWVLGDCGHITTGLCWEVRDFEKKQQKPKCLQLVEKLLPCGHSYKTECSNANTHLFCKQC